MSDPLDPEVADDPEDDLERRMLEMNAPALPTERLTAEELREPMSLDQELWRGRGEERGPDDHPVLVDQDGSDEEGELVADATREDDDDLAPEERAMRTETQAPGGIDDPGDGYEGSDGDDGPP